MNQLSIKTNTITSEIKHSLNLALPLVASFLVQQLTPFFGTVMIAHLGKYALDARVLGSAIYRFLIVFFFSLFSSVSILVSQSFGAKDDEGVKQSVSQAFKLAILLTIPIMALMWIAPLGLHWSKQNQHIIRLSTIYTRTLSIAVLPLSFLIVIERFLIAIQKTKIVLLISLLQVPFELLALYCFMFGKFGFPRMGLVGAAYAYIAVYTIAATVLSLFITFSKTAKIYHIFSDFWKMHYRFFKELIRVGWPIGISNTIEIGMFSMVAFMMGWLSSSELASYQIARQFIGILVVCLFAMARATSVRVGQAAGMNDKKLIKLTTYTNLTMSFSFMLLFAFLVIVFSHTLIGIDINPTMPDYSQLFHFATIYLTITMLGLLIESVRLNIVGALRGLKDTQFPMYVSFIALWPIGLVLAYLLSFVFHFRGVGLILGINVGLFLALIILLIRFHKLVKKIDLVKLVTLSQNRKKV